jgi:predicted 2-oxoglutarate/Fe(II)-dependent dioxygenase YbiX
MTPLLDQLWKVLESLGEASQFCTAGSLPPVLPGLEVEGVGNVGIPVSAADTRRLIEQASQAPYGRGEETIVDTQVRRVWQLEPRQFALRNAAWGGLVDDIVKTVRKEFGISKKVQAELYKLLVYEEGSFFAPHRDTEKIPGMFATLVVCLPSRHEGGTLLVTHEGETKRIDFGGPAAEFNLQYAAFYADCRHEITPVTSGYRVCLVYNLAIDRQKTQPSAPVSGPAVDAVAGLLPQLFADGSLDKIAIPFDHQYTEAGLDPRELKGADRARLAVLTRAAERVGYQVFVALLTHHQSGTPDYGTISYRRSRSRRRYRRFDGDLDDDISGEDEGAEFEEVYDESRSLSHWLDPQGRKQPFGKLSFEAEEIVGDAEDWPYKQAISEATGNEGATMERWYRQAVAVLWPRDRYFRILAGEGPAHAVPALEELVARTAQPAADADCRAFATEIINHWKKTGARSTWHDDWFEVEEAWDDEDGMDAEDEIDDEDAMDEGPGLTDPVATEPAQPTAAVEESLGVRMLTVLERIEAPDLAARFVHDILPTDCHGGEGPILSRLGNRFGWQLLAEPLQCFFASQKPGDYASKLATPVGIFEAMCASPPALTDDRRGVCVALADEVEKILERWDDRREQAWSRPEPRTGIVESVFRAFTALGEIDRLAQLVSYVLARPERYELRTVLIPAVKALHSELTTDSPGQGSLDRLLHHCNTELRSLTATPVEPPADWTRAADVVCRCADCQELVRFLRDPVEQVHRFPRRQELRQHLHQQIDMHHLDLTHETERRGRPQTLVCTKNQASYERRLAQFKGDVQFLKELEELAGGEATEDKTSSPPRRGRGKKGLSAELRPKKAGKGRRGGRP